MLAAWTRNRAEVELFKARGNQERIALMGSLPDARAFLQSNEVRFFLFEVEPVSTSIPGECATVLADLRTRAPIVIRYEPAWTTALELYHIAQLSLDLRDSCRSFDDFGVMLQTTHPPDATVVFPALRRIGDVIPRDLRALMAISLIVCRTPINEPRISRAADLRPDGAAYAFSRARAAGFGIPCFAAFNAALVALHVCWNRERRRLTARDAARLAGFEDTPQLDTYLKRNLGMTSKQILCRGGYALLLEWIGGWFIH